jgi:proline dehydrogenase
MPGERLESAIEVAQEFQKNNIFTVFTYLGENTKSLPEAEAVTEHYISCLESTAENNLDSHLSIKLTQIGLDLSIDETIINFIKIAQYAKRRDKIVWIDMEGSAYTQVTLDLFRKISEKVDNAGICLQAYLYRTVRDLKTISPLGPNVRLVKGAYRESYSIAYSRKADVDRNYVTLIEMMLEATLNDGLKPVFATHDMRILNGLRQLAENFALNQKQFEIHMLYGIRSTEQKKLREEGYQIGVLISYGESWFPWYIRRLAERPANLSFVLKNIFIK